MKENKKKANGNNYIIPSVVAVTRCRKKEKKVRKQENILGKRKWRNKINEIAIELIRGTLEINNNFRRTFEEQIARRT